MNPNPVDFDAPPQAPPNGGQRPGAQPQAFAMFQQLLQGIRAVVADSIRAGGGFNVMLEVDEFDEDKQRNERKQITPLQALVDNTNSNYALIGVMEEFMDRLEDASEAAEPKQRRRKKA